MVQRIADNAVLSMFSLLIQLAVLLLNQLHSRRLREQPVRSRVADVAAIPAAIPDEAHRAFASRAM